MTSTPEPRPRRTSVARPDVEPIASAVRDARRRRRLPPDAACIICGERDPIKLTTKGLRPVLEANHVAGRDNDKDLTAPYCLNHHAEMSARQLDAGVFGDSPATTVLERIERLLISLGIFFDQLAEACCRWAVQVAQVMGVLDQHLPGWRTIPGMS
jgi:hypothetical protein